MAGVARKFGVAGFLLSVGLACTQLFGDSRKNTLAPVPKKPPTTTGTLNPMPGLAEAAVCAAGAYQCSGPLLQTCADDLKSWVTVQRCAGSALCQVNPPLCLAAACGTDEMTCAGAVLQKCNAERTGWDIFDTCLSPAHCNADLRQCLPEPCTPGARRCDRSDADLSPVLEVCKDDRSDWAPLDACVTRELCDQTLTGGGTPGGLVLGSDGMVQVEATSTPATVVSCNLPACAVGEVRCEGARLEYCSEGRTGWLTAEECASEALCTGSLNNVTAAGVPACLPPVCGAGTHRCTETGVLQVCSEDRTGFRDQEQCIGAPFCNAVLADQGQAGCRDAPCEAGQMQCNGAQIQVCGADRTGLDDVGAPCESAALCNADDPSNAFCEPPVCHRGATAGDEFHCEGAQLQRCNESLTIYDTIQTCVTAALCDASQRFNGCKTPACQPGQHACNGGFLQTCNADQTGFENTENCGSQAQCDANAGRCADPCEPGSNRCNDATGDLETCRDRLTGWQPIADCPNVALCDLANRRCDICLGGQFSCADNQLRQCSNDGGSFSRQNIGPECASLPNNQGVGVRACQNNQVVVNACPKGCTNGRCNECQGNETQCVGNNQIRRCVNGFFGAPTSCSDGNACNGTETCQNNQCTGSPAPNCNDNNPCTSDSCVAANGCQFNPFSGGGQCINNGAQVQACVNGQLQTSNCTGFGCNNARCNNCNQGACANGRQFQTCDNGQLSAPRDCPSGQVCQGGGNCLFNCQQLNCNDNNPCTDDNCNAQQGCVHSNNNASCSDGNACNGNETCGGGRCNGGTPPNCNDNNGCTNDSCNAQQGCVHSPVTCPGGQTCQNGACGFNCAQQNCNDNNGCTNDSCNAQQGCVHSNNNNSCSDGNICNGEEACQNGSCQTVAFISCNDGDDCTDDQCVPFQGCVHNQSQALECTPCGGNFCSGNTWFECQAGRVVRSRDCNQVAGQPGPNGIISGICSPECACGDGCIIFE
jgi:hypothetical protein